MTLLERAEKAVKETAIPDRDGAIDRQEVARAVLKEMREPSEAMLLAGYLQEDEENGTLAIYQAMIDAALSE